LALQPRTLAVPRAFVAAILIFVGGRNAAMAEEQHAGEEAHHRHHMALFLGGVHAVPETEEEEGHEGEAAKTTAFAIGLDYEYRISRLLGVGFLGEYAGPRLETTVLAVPLSVHATRALVFAAAPGAEFHKGDSRFLVRLEALYEIELGGGFTLAPTVAVDFVGGEEAFIFGLKTGRGF